MIKFIGTYRLPEGTDPDQFWSYHVEEHAADIVRSDEAGRLRRYVVNRVQDPEASDAPFWAVVEMWFDSRTDMEQFMAGARRSTLASGRTVTEDFSSRVIDQRHAVVEEFVVPVAVRKPGRPGPA